MRVENCNVTIKLDRNEVWSLACAMSSCVRDRAKHYIEYKGTYIKGFWEDKAAIFELDIVRDLYHAIGEVSCHKYLESDIVAMFTKAKESEEASNANQE